MMKKIIALSLLAGSVAMAKDGVALRGVDDIIFDKGHFQLDVQLAFTSFENPESLYFGPSDPSNRYTNAYSSAGMPCEVHDLVNDPSNLVMVVDTGDFVDPGELAFDSQFEPPANCDDNDPDFPDDGLRFDFTGVTSNDFYLNDGELVLADRVFYDFTDGVQGFQIHDVDGKIIMESDEIDLSIRINTTLTVDYFLSHLRRDNNGVSEGYSRFESEDSLKIYARDLDTMTEYVIIDIQGTNGVLFDPMEDISFAWQSGAVMIPDTVNRIKVVIEGSTNSGDERITIDNVEVRGL